MTAEGLSLSSLVRVLRERSLLTQEELAQRCGVSVGTVRGLEAGRVTRPRSTTLRLLADALDLTDQERSALVAVARGEPVAADGALHRDQTTTAPLQLPPSIADFTGREPDIARLEKTLLADEEAPGPIAIAAITGRGGVGKTALAVHVAHRLAGHFQEGQLYVNLRGTQDTPVAPARALGRFLRALGVDESAIPDDIDERGELFRQRIAGRRCLVVLDDAASESQVRPLLPGAAGCAVVVTSRPRLGGLEGAHTFVLDVHTSEQATELLARVAGRERVAAEPRAAHEVVSLCGYLPLAIRIAGARLASRPHWRIADLVERLADGRRRLEELAAGDLDVRASIGLSYLGLDDASRRAFRFVGLLQAPDFAVWVVAALVDTTVAAATDIVDELVAAHLVEAIEPDPTGHTRYRLHDLVRLYARERAGGEDPEPERRAALTRALSAWLTFAERADDQMPSREHAKVQGGASRWRHGDQLAGSLLAEPLVWYETERVALLAAVGQASALGLDEVAWEVAASCYAFFDRRGLLDDWEHTHTVALAACRRAHNVRGQAVMARNLAGLCEQRGRDRLLACADEAIAASRALGDRRLEADALIQWGILHRHDDRRAGQAHIREGLAAAEAEVHTIGAIRGRLWLGVMQREAGDHDAAARLATRCVDLAREHGYPDQQIEALRLLGASCRSLGRYEQSEDALTEALRIACALGARTDEARVLTSLGDLYVHCGRAEARATLERGRALTSELGDGFGHALALRILAELDLAEARYDDAYAHLMPALDYSRQVGFAFGEALVLSVLGSVHVARGDAVAARSAWHDARGLFLRIGNTDGADGLAERLADLPADGAAAVTALAQPRSSAGGSALS